MPKRAWSRRQHLRFASARSALLSPSSLRAGWSGGRLRRSLVNAASFAGRLLRLLKAQRFLEDEAPVFLDLWPQLWVSKEGPSISEQPAPGGLFVQSDEHPQVAQVFLLFTREFADEDVILIDDKNAKPPEFAEPLPAVLPMSR